VVKYDVRKYFLLKELLTCGNPYHPWLLKHCDLIVLRHDYISFGLTVMFCMILKHSCWEPELEVIRTEIVSFIMPYIDMGIDTTACAHGTNTI